MRPFSALLPLLVAALVSLVMWSDTRPQPLMAYDQPFYLGIADDLVRHGRFTDGFMFAEPGPDGARPAGMRFSPLYPMLLATMSRVDGGLQDGMTCLAASRGRDPGCRGGRSVRALQFGLLVGCFWMVWLSGLMLAGPLVAWLAMILALGAAPLLLLSVDYLMTETLSLFLCMLAATLTLRGMRNGAVGAAWLAGAGAALGLAILTRPAFEFLIPFGIAMGLAALASPRFRRPGIVPGILAFAGAAAGVMLPWMLRNVAVMHRFGLTFGYASHTLVQRFSFDRMSWREWGMSFVCWLPDGNGLGSLLRGRGACARFGWDAPDSFYIEGLGRMLRESLAAAGGWEHHFSWLVRHFLLADPWRQIPWHLAVTLPLALRGSFIEHYWGFALMPVCLVWTVKALRGHAPGGFLLTALPAWFMLVLDAGVAVNQPRYNLMLVLPFSLAGAMLLEPAAARLGRRRRPAQATGTGSATATATRRREASST
ncbi:hypothetical protein [Rhizosaccharibacter radicis]|uniref:Glycosyltransferase RgtA/B/C/D-like domain-containing protein n=1 Tax=Rhizosaccharibacter radicis TaxID=2782605 RepID=A0ABT1VWX5_9PROT|nr:hypothetical protein [Acetobacteraceae bacterium KSS12]